MKKIIAVFGILVLCFTLGFSQPKSKSVLIHQVYFWLKKDLSPTDISKFEAGVKSLQKIKHVSYSNLGKPASTTKRPVVDDTYSYALVLYFKDIKAHDAYQIDPTHENFIKECANFWEKVQVYDAASVE